MEQTLARFVHALRSADIAVSPAETLDALAVARTVGLDDPRRLHDALSLALAKSPADKVRFRDCFDRFFGQLAFRQPAKRTFLRGVNAEQVRAALSGRASAELVSLVDAMLAGDHGALAWRVEQQADELGVESMSSLRDKDRLARQLGRALGLEELAGFLGSDAAPGGEDLAPLLRYLRQYAREQVEAYVDARYRLIVDASGRRAVIEAALAGQLDQLPPGYHAEVDRVVRQLAERLSRRHRRRQRRARRGLPDLKRTLRESVGHDAVPFRLHWRHRRRERGTVFVVCDLSSSVSRIARFLLLFLHRLTDVLPEVRTFGFSNRAGELSASLRAQDPVRAVEEALFVWGKGSTDYGQALFDFRELVGRDLDHRSVVVFLGDARGNYFPPRLDVMREISRRARQVFWLNPEPADRWGEGDSLMRHYAPFCLHVDRCARLQDIERFADRLLTLSR